MKQRGFTLIEIMVVVMVMAVLASIALPSYQEQVRKGRRADALAAMNETAQALERFYTLNNTYTGYTLRATEQQSPRQGDVVFYRIAMRVTDGGVGYAITATPQQEDRCGTLTLNSQGVRAAAYDDCVR
jgi:type IV pilus assembly protein PilE